MAKNASTKQVVEGLSKVLASTYTLYLKTQNFHWNVTGPHFPGLHIMFENQYTELAAAIDELAERIRALGETAPGNFATFTKLSVISGAPDKPQDWKTMVKTLAKDHEKLSELSGSVREAADAVGDDGTFDMLVKRSQVHEKTAWMLEATIG